jgi:hypothetical protein
MTSPIALLSQTDARLSRLTNTIATLVEAQADANEFKADKWEFALSVHSLYRSGLNEADLRWMISTGLVEHAVEKTNPDAEKRSFMPTPGCLLTDHSCFVLTQAGCALAENLSMRQLPGRIPPVETGKKIVRPHWNFHERELTLGGELVKRFRTPARCQEIILNGFQRTKWLKRIDNPLPRDTDVDPSQQVRDAVRRLNSNQQDFQKISFTRDGTGNGICWAIA